MRFARRAGYERLVLWTNPELHAARRIYEGVGFRLVRTERTSVFGRPQTAQIWELRLRPAQRRNLAPLGA